MKEIDLFNSSIESFGNKALKENIDSAEQAISRMENSFRVFNHSNSQFVWQNFILNHKNDNRNLRQISAEINKKRQALIEAKYKYLERQIDIEELEEQLKSTSNQTIKKRIILKIEQEKEFMKLMLPPIEGAIKDILLLEAIYQQIINEIGLLDEKKFEEQEVQYWIRRCISQCLRDIREQGTITKGEQENIENMGINLSKLYISLKNYIQTEQQSNNLNGECLDIFLEDCVTKYKEIVLSSKNGFAKSIVDRTLFYER